jgi:hypothetical protein
MSTDTSLNSNLALREQTASNQTLAASRGEWRFVVIVTLAVLALTTLPYLFATLTGPSDQQFMGFMLDVPDHGQYLSWYKGFQTSLLVPNKLTSEPNKAVFFNLLWFVLGRVGALTGWDYALIYQLFRWVAGALFMSVLYLFCRQTMKDPRWRLTAFSLVSLGGGLGWIWVVLKYTFSGGELLYPLDVYVAEGNSFLCILGYPHFAIAAALIVTVFGLLLAGARRGQLRYAVAAAVVALILGWQHAYDILILYSVPGIYALFLTLWQRRLPPYWTPALIVLGAVSVWPALYSVWLTKSDPLWEAVLEQFANAGVFTPDPFHLLILMGLPLVAALATFAIHLRRRETGAKDDLLPQDAELFVSIWFVTGFFLNYVPTDFQIHMLNSWQVPVGLLATWGLYRYLLPALAKRRLGRSQSRWISLAPALFVLLTLPVNLYIWTWRYVELDRHDYPFYLHQDEVAALHWLDEHTDPDQVVLSSLTVGQYVPGVAGNTAFLAHWAQTVDFYTKEALVAEFFAADSSDETRRQILREHDLAYIFYGPAERALGEFDPSQADYLEIAFTLPSVTLLRVRPESLNP